MMQVAKDLVSISYFPYLAVVPAALTGAFESRKSLQANDRWAGRFWESLPTKFVIAHTLTSAIVSFVPQLAPQKIYISSLFALCLEPFRRNLDRQCLTCKKIERPTILLFRIMNVCLTFIGIITLWPQKQYPSFLEAHLNSLEDHPAHFTYSLCVYGNLFALVNIVRELHSS